MSGRETSARTVCVVVPVGRSTVNRTSIEADGPARSNVHPDTTMSAAPAVRTSAAESTVPIAVGPVGEPNQSLKNTQKLRLP